MRERKSRILKEEEFKKLSLTPKEGWARINVPPYEVFINPRKREVIEKIGEDYIKKISCYNRKNFNEEAIRFFRLLGGEKKFDCGSDYAIYMEFCRLHIEHICNVNFEKEEAK